MNDSKRFFFSMREAKAYNCSIGKLIFPQPPPNLCFGGMRIYSLCPYLTFTSNSCTKGASVTACVTFVLYSFLNKFGIQMKITLSSDLWLFQSF